VWRPTSHAARRPGIGRHDADHPRVVAGEHQRGGRRIAQPPHDDAAGARAGIGQRVERSEQVGTGLLEQVRSGPSLSPMPV
jgi:hypothetical protein